MFKKIVIFTVGHKIVSAIIVIAVLLGGYEGYQKIFVSTTSTRYVLALAQKGTVVSYITGSGQVSVSTQLDLKAKASADVVYVGVQDGDHVKAGTLIAELDSTNAEKVVRDAEANLDAAHLSLQKLQKPADDLSVLQAENAIAQAKESKQNAEAALKKAYDDGFNTVANAFLDLSPTMSGLQDMLYGATLSTGGQSNVAYYADVVKNYDGKSLDYKNDVISAYDKARQEYDKNFQNYKSLTRFSDNEAIANLINETYETARNTGEAIKGSNNLIQFYEDKLVGHSIKPNPLADTHLASLITYTGKMNGHILNLRSIKNTIDADTQAVTNADRSIAEKIAILTKLKAGADVLDIESQQLAITQRENALLDAKDTRADYFIYAPFDSIVAKVNVKKGDSASNATSIATIITQQQVAEISMNEIDVAKVKTGEKVTLTFDAIPDLSITGKVVEIDTIGTLSQGVVSYTVKIGFDTQDNRIKPGMSVSASIITDTKTDVLTLPNSAVKSQNNGHYVEVPDSTEIPLAETISTSGIALSLPTMRKQIEVGISNDNITEITSGLHESDIVISRTITSSPATVQAHQTSSIRLPGFSGGGGGSGGFRGGGGARGD